MKKYFILLLALLYVFPIKSQTYPVNVIDYADGLAKSNIYTIAKDWQGYMWMGSDATLIRYDGSRFVYYTTRDGFGGTYVMDIDFAPDDTMWISTYGGGLAKFDGKKFHAYDRKNGFPAGYVRELIFTPDGDVWTATEDEGVVRIPAGKKPEIIKNQEGEKCGTVWGIMQSSTGDIWSAGGQGVIQFKKSENYKAYLRQRVGYITTSLVEDKDGGIWTAGAFHFSKIFADTIVDYTHLLPAGTIVFDMEQSKDRKKIYLATASGLLVYENNEMRLFDKNNGIKNHQFWDVFLDENEDVWLASGGGGVVKYDTRGIEIFEGQGDLQFGSMILDMLHDAKDNMVIETELNGMFYYKDGVFSMADDPDIKQISSCYAMDTDPVSEITVLTSSRGDVLWTRNKKTLYKYHPPVEKAKIAYGISMLDSMEVMILSDDGCYRIKPGMDSLVKMKEIPQVFCKSVFKDSDGNRWILGDKGEIFIWSEGKVEDVQKKYNPSGFGLYHGMYDEVHGLYWFCSNGGVIVSDGKKSLTLHSGNGLGADMAVSITMDDKHRIWVGHDRGITGIDPEKKSFIHVGYQQGFISVAANARSLLVKGNILWAGSTYELYKIDMNALEPVNRHIKLRLQQIKWDKTLYFEEEYFTDSLPVLHLNYNQNNLVFSLQALDFEDAGDARYSWMLEGYDKDFLPFTGSYEAGYTNLAPGSYTFKAKALDPDGFLTNEVKIRIEIGKPFWKKLWFYFLEVGLFGLIVLMSFIFSSRDSNNRFGQIMTFLTIIILFESFIFYVSAFIDPLTNGIPVFQLLMNIVLAAVLSPAEKWVKRMLTRRKEE